MLSQPCRFLCDVVTVRGIGERKLATRNIKPVEKGSEKATKSRCGHLLLHGDSVRKELSRQLRQGEGVHVPIVAQSCKIDWSIGVGNDFNLDWINLIENASTAV